MQNFAVFVSEVMFPLLGNVVPLFYNEKKRKKIHQRQILVHSLWNNNNKKKGNINKKSTLQGRCRELKTATQTHLILFDGRVALAASLAGLCVFFLFSVCCFLKIVEKVQLISVFPSQGAYRTFCRRA